jgi:hypothetical protein
MQSELDNIKIQLNKKLIRLKEYMLKARGDELRNVIKELAITKAELNLIKDPEYKKILDSIPNYSPNLIMKIRKEGF